ncbi:MAG TPA: SDR family oxidoreductase [Myxococcaceae bacterium]|nr:SDR family oxidoreductase [Myxococcaceae bacterium]
MKQVLLITGSSGIAAATARMWAAEDPVFVVGIQKEECRSLTAELADSGFAAADVRDASAVRDAVAACLERFGRIDALFNVAGISARSAGDGPLHECKPEAWDAAMEVNAKGTFLMCREVLGAWTRNAQPGVILNTGSVLARHPQRDYFTTAGYAASKGAVEAMSVGAAAYYAPSGIRINVIAPGLVCTPMTARAQASAPITGYITHKQPLTKGMLSAEDIAKTACFLLRSESSPITGQVVTVDGGWTVSE